MNSRFQPESDNLVLEEMLKNCLTLSDNANAIHEDFPDSASSQILKMKSEFPPDFYQGEIPTSDKGSNGHLHNYILSMLTDKSISDSSRLHTPSQVESSTKTTHATASKTRNGKKPGNGSRKQQEFGANMVIHVCDEGKKLNQDFTCPRNLLVKEMKYFAEYLSLDSQRLEEVDISVHCDIHIFDWLMRYVKRSTNLIQESEIPQLEANNVVSILISSDFLRMDSLVTECVAFCHENMSSILSTPCNMNCINDRLCARIAKRFTHNELDDVRDRKDKFKSKLFCKKIVEMFEDSEMAADASTLFKCGKCQRVMTKSQSSRLACSNQNLTISSDGKLAYQHQVDPSWDINSWIVSLYEELHQWALVYWRLWATVNDLQCSTCGVHFQLFEFGHCKYHPDKANFTQFVDHAINDTVIGVYQCCNRNVLRFDPTQANKGCQMRDHAVLTEDPKRRRILDDLHLHASYVKVESCPADSDDHDSLINIFASEESSCCIPDATVTSTQIKRKLPSSLTKKPPTSPDKRGSTRRHFISSDDEDEDESSSSDDDDDIAPKRRIPLTKLSRGKSQQHVEVKPPAKKRSSGAKSVAKDSTVYRRCPSKHRWDANRTNRYNQDMQREEDRRRMNALSLHLSRSTISKTPSVGNHQQTKELSGGLFVKLEHAFMNNLKTTANERRASQGNALSNNRDARNKYRGR